jgi:hypothetical protein
MDSEKLSTKETVEEVLQESRMVLPGIQALFGFQLIAFFNTCFGDLSKADKLVHLVALFLTISAIGLLMAPAAYHRQVERDSVSHSFVKYASFLMTVGMAPLAASIALDTEIVSKLATNSANFAITAATSVFALLIMMWYLIPQVSKHRR